MSDAPTTSRRMRVSLLGLGFVVLAVVVAGIALRDELPAVLDAAGRIPWWRLLGAVALVVLGLLATAQVWRACLARLGSPVSTAAARRIFFPSQVGKYLPGSIWPFLAQQRFARGYGVPGGIALLAGAVFLAVHAMTAVLVAAVLLVSQPVIVHRYGWFALCVPLALVALHPKVVTALARRLAARSGAEAPVLRWPDLAGALAWMLPTWLCYGVAGYLLAAPFGGSPVPLALACTGAFALGWLVGLVVFIAPAGIGAREAVLIVVLTPLVGVAAATSVSILLRVCHTLADTGLALSYGLTGTRRGRAIRPEPR